MNRQQFTIQVSRMRQDGNDKGAVDFWLHNGTGISWREFQKIDPMGDHGEFAARVLRTKQTMEGRNQ